MTTDSNDKDLDEVTSDGYTIEDFKEVYRKHHNGAEPKIAFIVELMSMQSALLAILPDIEDYLSKSAVIEAIDKGRELFLTEKDGDGRYAVSVRNQLRKEVKKELGL